MREDSLRKKSIPTIQRLQELSKDMNLWNLDFCSNLGHRISEISVREFLDAKSFVVIVIFLLLQQQICYHNSKFNHIISHNNVLPQNGRDGHAALTYNFYRTFL